MEYFLIIDLNSQIVCKMMVVENHYHSTTTHKLYMDKSKHPDPRNIGNEEILKRLLKPISISFIFYQLMDEKAYLLSSPIELLFGFDNSDEIEEELFISNVTNNIKKKSRRIFKNFKRR